jgi:hypothetical protein
MAVFKGRRRIPRRADPLEEDPMPSTSRNTQIQRAQAISNGLQKYCTGMTFMLGGKQYTVAELVALANAIVAAGTAVTQAKEAYHDAIVAEAQAMKSDGAVLEQLRESLAVSFSNSSPTLAALEITPRKANKPLTVAQLAAREAKAKATRAARGTTGKKEKQAIKGSVTGVDIVPITTGTAASASTATPATSPTVSVTTTGTASH